MIEYNCIKEIDIKRIEKIKGQMTFDLAIALVIIMLIVYTGLNIISITVNRSNERLTSISKYNKLLMVADNIVKHGKTEVSGFSTVVYHHIIDKTMITDQSIDKYEKDQDLNLYIKLCDFGDTCPPPNEDMLCITRIVIDESNAGFLGSDRVAKKLLVCGN